MRPDDAADMRGDRGEIHDAAPAAAAHSRQSGLRDEEAGLEVRVDDVVPIIFGDGIDRLRVGDAGVVDEDVDGAQLGFDGADELRDLSGDGDIGLDGDGAASELADFGGDSFGFCSAVNEVDGNIGSGGGESQCNAAADATAGAGDESDAADKRGHEKRVKDSTTPIILERAGCVGISSK